MVSNPTQPRNLLVLALCGMFCWTGSLATALSQELEKKTLESIVGGSEIELRQIVNTLNLEIRVLEEMRQRILEEAQRLRAESMDQLQSINRAVEDAETLVVTSTDLETNSQLISNCLSELQRIEWEEATEESAIAEAPALAVPPEFERERQKLRSEIEISRRDLEHLRAKGTRLKELYERNSVSSVEYQEHVAQLAHNEAVLQGLAAELGMVEESAKAATQAPTVAAKQRLADLRARKKIVVKQLKQLQARQTELKEARFKEQSLSRLIDQAFRLSENELPMRIKLIESEVMRQAVEREIVLRKQAAEKVDAKQ